MRALDTAEESCHAIKDINTLMSGSVLFTEYL